MMSMKTDRELIRLARGNLGVDRIAASFDMTTETVLKIGKRLGIHLKPSAPKRNVRLEATGE